MLTPFSIDEVRLMERKTLYQVSTKCGNDKTFYRFGFNGQEKDNELKGKGNVNTAEFWEYDTRFGRRWNIDPVDETEISSYACFDDNPIYNTDVKGDYPNGPMIMGGPALTRGATKIIAATKNAIVNWVSESHKRGMSYVDAANKTNRNLQSKDKISNTTKALVYVGSYWYAGIKDILPSSSNVEDAKNAKHEFAQGNFGLAAMSAIFAFPEIGNVLKLTKSLKGAGKIGGTAYMDFAEDFIVKQAKFLEKKGFSVSKKEINDPNLDFIGTITDQVNSVGGLGLSTTGKHQFVEVVDKKGVSVIFDNAHFNGILKSDYEKTLNGAIRNTDNTITEINGKGLLESAKPVKK